jgi:hypothetical protein
MKTAWPLLALLALAACSGDLSTDSPAGPSVPPKAFEGAEKALGSTDVTAQGYCRSRYYLHNGYGKANNVRTMIYTQYPFTIFDVTVASPSGSSRRCSRQPGGVECQIDLPRCHNWANADAVAVDVHHECGYTSRIGSYSFNTCY